MGNNESNTTENREKTSYLPDCCLRHCFNWKTIHCKYCKRSTRAKSPVMDYFIKDLEAVVFVPFLIGRHGDRSIIEK